MKRIILTTLVILLGIVTVSAQSDEIIRHNGDHIKGDVVRITEYEVVFRYENESSENMISRYAVEKIIYGKSGRVEKITDKVTINNEDDWEKVVVLEDKLLIAGLTKGPEIRGKTAFVNLHSGNTGDKKSLKKLKMAAAKANSPFILLTSEKSTVGSTSNQLGGSQSIKSGIAYNY